MRLAGVHVEHILSKLGFLSRAQVADCAAPALRIHRAFAEQLLLVYPELDADRQQALAVAGTAHPPGPTTWTRCGPEAFPSE